MRSASIQLKWDLFGNENITNWNIKYLELGKKTLLWFW